MIPNQRPNDAKPITYRPVPFNFVDLESKASDYLSKVKAEAVQIAAQARNEVARLREQALTEIKDARQAARDETETIRKQLDGLQKELREEEENFSKRKAELETEAARLKVELEQNTEQARKTGYDEGHALGYEEGRTQGYGDGETQALVDYSEKLRNEAAVQLGTQLETLMPALNEMVGQLETAKQSFLQLWEHSAIQIATKIAERAIGRQLPEMVDVPLRLLRETLELGAGSTSVRIRMNPGDVEALRPQVDMIVGEMGLASQTEVVADPKISLGGCVLETSLGMIDNQIEARLERIEHELVISE